jgi:hypothetical protein
MRLADAGKAGVSSVTEPSSMKKRETLPWEVFVPFPNPGIAPGRTGRSILLLAKAERDRLVIGKKS